MKFLKSAITVMFSLCVFVACGSNGNSNMEKKSPNSPNKEMIQKNPGTMNQGTIKSRKDTAAIDKKGAKDTTDTSGTMPENGNK